MFASSQRGRTVTSSFCWLIAAVIPALAQDPSLDALVRAYPDFLASHDGVSLLWKDGMRTPVSDGRKDKSHEEKLHNPSILDQLSVHYVRGPLTKLRGVKDDPGRFRNVAFFNKMYGDCSKREVQKKLARVAWLPKSGGDLVEMTTVNGVANKLRAVSVELDRLPPDIKQYVFPSAGTFNCRTVKDTGNPSMHAWSAAIDINIKFADYWLWSKSGYRNRIPMQIVEIFEKHGFIWGGKWGHFDTIHFEYRPELLEAPDSIRSAR